MWIEIVRALLALEFVMYAYDLIASVDDETESEIKTFN